MENRFIIDWLSFTSKYDSVASVITAIGLEHIIFLPGNGFYGYGEALFFEGIRIHFNGREDMGILVEMSGTGCRAFETYNTIGGVNAVFNLILENEYNVTRIDVAYDIFNGIVPLVEMADDVRNKNWVSKFTAWEVIESDRGLNINIGSKASDIMFRFYDKHAEQSSKGIAVDTDSWVRCEMQCRRERAMKLIELYNGDNLGDIFCGVLLNYFRVIIPDTNAVKSRCTVAEYWCNLINNAVKVKLFTRSNVDYNIHKLENYVVKQAGGAIDTYIRIVGIDFMRDKLLNTPRTENPKYTQLLSEYFTVQNASPEPVEDVAEPVQIKARTEMPVFVLPESAVEQMEFDLDPLTDDLSKAYKPHKY